MNKKENRMAVRQTVEKAVIRDEQNRRIQSAATNPVKEVLKIFHTTLRGLEADTVSVNRSKYGTNKVTHEKKKSLAKRVAGAFINPFTAILFCLAFVSTITDMIFPYFSLFGSVPEDFDFLTVVIILTMVFISGTLRFVQESRSGNAAEKLLAMITTTCTVTRIGQEKTEIPMDDLVVGDIVHLSAGDMIPADVRILDAKDLFVSQASLTGESEPVEKLPHVSPHKDSVTDYTNIAFMGSNVISGSATAVVICVGDHTLFGSMAAAVAGEAVETSFTKGVNAVSWVLIRFMLVMVPLVFFVNGITKGDWLEAFLFGISIAVGLTPEMLPMIVTTCLAKGAVSMSKKQTIVKNLNSIQNFGAMDILCTDKTGTLTQDKVVLEYHLNVNGEDDTRVLRHAYLNSYFQTGYKNLMDLAIIHKTEEMEAADKRLIDLSETYVKVDEIPFDFKRRRLSTVVQDKNGKTQMVTKGAVEEMLSINPVSDFFIKSYQTVAPPLLRTSKRLQSSILPLLKEEAEGGKQKNLLFGKRLDMRALHRKDGGIFTRTRLPDEEQKLSVGLLVDESGSMGWGDRITHARKTAIVLYDFCTSLGIPITIYGHSTDSKGVALYSYAEFDSLDASDRYRLMDMSARNGNRDGAALRYVAEHLAKRPESQKLLIIISDGQPADCGYSGTEAEADLRGIKNEYRKRGIVIFAAAIGDDKENIRRIYQDGFLDITKLEDLPKNMTQLVKQYLK